MRNVSKPQIPSPQTIKDPVLRGILVTIRDRVETLALAANELSSTITGEKTITKSSIETLTKRIDSLETRLNSLIASL